MGTFKTSDGERVTKTFIDGQIRKTKKQFTDDAYDEGLNYCWACERNDKFLSCSHIVSVNKCQNDGRAEKAWDYENLQLECLDCHAETERGTISHHENCDYKLEYIEDYNNTSPNK